MAAGEQETGQFRRLRKRAQFLNAARGRKTGRTGFSVQAIAADDPSPGLGLTVTNKIGNSPERNRIRRRLRAAARACGGDFLPQHDYVLVGRREALTEPFAKIVADLSSALLKLNAPPRPSGSQRP
jgi:ribonuclease P protein component